MSFKDKKDALLRAWKKGDILPKAVCFFLMKAGFSNRELQALEVRNKNYRYLKKKYSSVLNQINYQPQEDEEDDNDNIWICWFQGLEHAPELVKRCVESVYKNMPDKNIHIVTEENMGEYVHFPEHIVDKWKKGIISHAHQSDVLRTELLIKYGGMWIDATAYFTDRVPDYIYKKSLFLFHYKVREDMTISNNNWFIYAKRNNRSLLVLRDLLYAYWKKENRLREYFIWHQFLKMVFEKYPEDYDSIYYVSDEMAHMLKYNIFKKFDPVYWEEIKRFSYIHKLTYKLNVPENIQDTYYDYFLRSELERY